MFLKGSRYADARLFETDARSGERFAGVRPRTIGPAPGVIEHTVRAGDRLDLLARNYYNDARLWWRIVDANPEYFYGADLLRERAVVLEAGELSEERTPVPDALIVRPDMVGRVILIPRARE